MPVEPGKAAWKVPNGTVRSRRAGMNYTPRVSGALLAPIARDCVHYRGDRPCGPSKTEDVICGSCSHYRPVEDRVLVIKLDALGDVVRTAALLPAIRASCRNPHVTWITRDEALPLVAMMPLVDRALALAPETHAILIHGRWDRVFNFSNDVPSASLASSARSRERVIGFELVDGVITPTSPAAHHWLTLACFDRFKRANRQTYGDIMAAMIGPEARPQRPRLVIDADARARAQVLLQHWRTPETTLIGVIAGSGKRWPKKMLDADAVAALCRKLAGSLPGARILVLGGSEEITKITHIRKAVGTGSWLRDVTTQGDLPLFAALIEACDAVVTGDTLGLHLATAFARPTVAVFGPTSAAEIDDYGTPMIKITAGLSCVCCYGDCTKPKNCMSSLDHEEIAQAVTLLLTMRGGAVRQRTAIACGARG